MSKYKTQSLKGKISIKHGFPFKSEFFDSTGHYIVLTPGNFFEAGGFKREYGKEKFYHGEFPKEYILKTKDLIVAMTEQAEGLLGSCAFVPEDNIYLHNQRLGLVSINENQELNFDYLYYLFQTKFVREQIRLTSTGSKVKHTSPDKLTSVIAPLPSIDIQEKIAHVLSILDKKIETNNKINKELEAMAKTLYNYWFVQFDFPNEDGKPYKSSGGKMEYNKDLKRDIPLGWEVSSLFDIEPNIITGKTPSTSKAENYGSEVPFITIADIRNNTYITKTEQNLSKVGADSQNNKYLPADSLCVSCIATVGLIGFTTTFSQTNQQINSIIFRNEENKSFLFFALNNYFNNFFGAKTGATFDNMNKGEFSSIQLATPPKEIRNLFHKTVNSSLQQIKSSSQQNLELTKLRDWLLPMLMNGQVKVK